MTVEDIAREHAIEAIRLSGEILKLNDILYSHASVTSCLLDFPIV